MNFESIINEIRNNFNNDTIRNIKLRKPLWVRNSILNCIYADKKHLERSGKIVYGHLVQANSNIFRTTLLNRDLPGVMLYSMDPYYDAHPEELGMLAHEIFYYKNKKDAPADIAKFAKLMANEYSYEQNIELPRSITPNGKVYLTTFTIWRNHLIDNYLKKGIFPVLADPDYVKSVMIVPKEYWTKEYENFYNYKK